MSDLSAPAADVRAGFFRLPKVLFMDKRYRGLSTDAKVLYALMLDRMGLSIRNGWADKTGRVFIYFTLDEIRKLLGCGHGKATGLCRELEDDAALIERGPQVKKGRPQPIYVRDFACVYGKPAAPEPEKTPEKPEPADSPDTENRQREPETAELSPRFQQSFQHEPDGGRKPAARMPKIGRTGAENRPHGCRKPAASYTDFNKIDLSYTDPSIVPFPRGTPLDNGMDRADVSQTIRENISYDILLQKRPDEKSRIDGIVSLLVDTVCSRRPYLRISGEEIPIGDVRERLLSLDDGHIEYVFDCMDESTVPIGNIRAYLLAALYMMSPHSVSQIISFSVLRKNRKHPFPPTSPKTRCYARWKKTRILIFCETMIAFSICWKISETETFNNC